MRLADYVHIKSIQAVPEHATPISYVRQHVKGAKRLELDRYKKAQLYSVKSGQPIEVCLSAIKEPQTRSRLPLFGWKVSKQSLKQKAMGIVHFHSLFGVLLRRKQRQARLIVMG